SAGERDRMTEAIAAAARLGSETDGRAALYRLGEVAYRDGVALAAAWSGSEDDPCWAGRFALPRQWRAPTFPLAGRDVVAAGVPRGPEIGRILKLIENWWVAGNFAAD